MEWSPEIFNVGTICLILALSFTGAIIQGTMGFGFAIVTAPFLYTITPDFIPAPLIITLIPLGILMIRKERSAISKTIISSLIIGRIPGTFLGAALLGIATRENLSLMLGSMVITSVILSVTKLSIRATKVNMLLAGFASGVTATAASIGGPPMALVLQNEKGASVRANLSCVNVVCSAISLGILFVYGRFSAIHVSLAAMVMPGLLCGLWVSRHIVKIMRPDALRPLALILCLVSGSMAIFNSF
ncbi:sulfite exporter TauE/SafE family protein [Parendozoicomonas sp. Alg238-R29]|uniref:sulfite exporter TauE/SafE family protein n=1 Tax=Parendozoicomonas sp. Alg238-R29 TaxID=2993446 RepID=UPI00248E0FDA|nr:sulfite exporter TauE/SafE family protein [Parendozoicomonas sp. Alg238-R29]